MVTLLRTIENYVGAPVGMSWAMDGSGVYDVVGASLGLGETAGLGEGTWGG